MKQLNQQVSVSEQLHKSDVQTLKDAGVEIVVCNRPDGEAEGQPAFESIARACSDLGMRAVNIPFSGNGMTDEQIAEFKTLLAEGRRTHAYCRTGNRSTNIWRAAGGQEQAPANASAPVAKTQAAKQFDVVIVGSGSGGAAVASSILKRQSGLRIALIDPAEVHYYQPGWTMVGGGVFNVKTTVRPMRSVIPRGVDWLKARVSKISADDNKVSLDDGSEVHYRQLVVAVGLKLNWGAVEGLNEALGKNGVTSNYTFETAPYTRELVEGLKGGKALFTQPPMPIKCAGAPQKALYLSADYWLKQGVLNKMDIHFFNAGPGLFGVKEYVPALQEYMDKYKANLHFGHTLVKVDGEKKLAYFKTTNDTGEEHTHIESYDMLHVCPPQVAPELIAMSELADNSGWMDVDPNTLQHTKHSNVWGLGDATNTPNAKTMAAARKQAPVVAENLLASLAGMAASASYDGYGSCPLTVERGKIVLAEFGYGGKLLPSFPNWFLPGTKATRRAWWLKEKFLPWMYWSGMLKGREWLATPKKLKS